MSSLKRNLFLSVFGAAMSATAVFAADLPAPPVIEYEPETPVEIGNGWYLRGDLGYTIYDGGEASWIDNLGHPPSNIVFSKHDIDNGWVAGVGAGYYINEHFRADVTLDYRHDAKYEAEATCPPSTCTSRESVDFSAWTLMANGYVDFGSYYSITPYVGGGIGVAWLNVDNYSTSQAGSRVFGNHTQTNFAWNLTAGAAFDIADHVKLDANYRFVSLGSAKTGDATDHSGANPVKFDDLYAHDFRVGLRYDLN